MIYLTLHITAGVYLYAEDFPYNFADLEQKFLCGGLNRLRYGCLLFLTCFSGKERGPSVSCLEASAPVSYTHLESVFSSHTLYRKTPPECQAPAEFLSLSDYTGFPGQCLMGAGELPVKLFEDTLPGPGRLLSCLLYTSRGV